MAVAVERIVVQVPPSQKKAFMSKAKRLGLNLSELMRRGATAYSPEEAEAEFDALAEKIVGSTTEARAALDDALAFVAESNKRIAAMEER